MHSEQIVNSNVTMLTLGRLDNNAYIVHNNNNCIIIDCPYDNGQLLSYVTKNNLNVQGIVLTHGHFDHCGGVATILEEFDVDVYCHSDDWQLCAHASENRWRVKCDDCIATCHLAEGRVVIGDFSFDVMHTAGHTSGGVCIMYQDVLFSGDTLFDGTIGRTDLGGSTPVIMNSLAKLKALEGDYILCAGHGGVSTLDIQRNNNIYMVNL